jgi:hypothetical protein
MDSKTSSTSVFPDQDEAPPPSYSSTVTSNNPILTGDSSSKQGPSPITHNLRIQSQLETLTPLLSSLRLQKALLSHATDEKILSLLTVQIQHYISSFARSGLRKGTLILVPAKALTDQTAVPVDYDFQDETEYDRLVRVGVDEEGKNVGGDDGFGDSGYGDSGYGDSRSGEEMWFWRDQEMVMRLAGYLKPAPTPKPKAKEVPRKDPVKTPVEPPPSSSLGFWRRKKSFPLEKNVASSSTPSPASASASRETSEKAPLPESDLKTQIDSPEPEDKVVMDIRAEEVCFRTENDFGVFENETGWCVVLKLKVVSGGSIRK